VAGGTGSSYSLAAQSFFFVREAPPHSSSKHNNCSCSAHIKEVTETHLVQVVCSEDLNEEEDGPLDFFHVLATEKKRESR
jgi:hypothetical protein